MRILDILTEELVTPTVTQKRYNGQFEPQFKAKNDSSKGKIIGQGTQASVKQDPTDPHMVRKHNIRPYSRDGQQDGFNDFINFLINNEFLDNIHFPKVYDIKTIKDRYGRQIHTYRMERLIPHTELTDRELKAVAAANFKGMDLRWIEREKDPDAFNRIAMEQIVVALGEAIGERDTKAIASETLQQAVDITARGLRALGANLDIDSHLNNVMFRRQSTGVVLVINDPFY